MAANAVQDMSSGRDHGGNLDIAISLYGGARADWVDLSTGINPVAYPIAEFSADAWTALPDEGAMERLVAQARRFWNVPAGAAILAAPGCSALIAQIPTLASAGVVDIPGPTYNEHAASFAFHGWRVQDAAGGAAAAQVIVNPNNPTGTFWTAPGDHALRVIDESFCDVAPARSLIAHADQPGVIVLKSFGKFWGLAGVRLGFAIGDPQLIGGLRDRLGPWAVSGPALEIGARALADDRWAEDARAALSQSARQLDALMGPHVDTALGEVPLFRTYQTPNAQALHQRLARHHIWSRLFLYNPQWIRLGLPCPDDFARLEAAL